MANTAFNVIALGVSGLLSIPAFTSLFAQPQPEKITINIGVGATNSEVPPPPGANPSGNVPFVTLYDVNGNQIGRETTDTVVVDGGSIQVTIGGAEGSRASETPEYIQLQASGTDEVCIAWLTTSSAASDGADFRSWNGATGAFCNVTWYPSTAQFPGVSNQYEPPCIWMSNDGRFVDAFTAHLLDFFFPGSNQATQTTEQWQKFPDTLCKAPARQQFYNNTGDCIPFYPSGLKLAKDPDTGFDVDFELIESSFTQSCSVAGIPFNCDVNLVKDGPPNAPCPFTIDNNPSVTLPPSIVSQLQSQLTFNLGGGQVVATTSTTAVDADSTADGVGNFGGTVGEIPKDGAGNFGGVVGEIPAADAGQQPATTSTTSSTPVQVKPSFNIGDQGAVLVSINPGGPDGTWEAATALATAAKARARREADRAAAAIRAEITPAPAYNPNKLSKKQKKAATPERRAPVHERQLAKRDEEPHNWCKENQLVVSEHTAHSAREVCGSSSSWGPDFVSVAEGVYCDMCKREIYPLCSGENVGESGVCFDLGKRQLVGAKKRWWKRDTTVGPVKRWDSVRVWK